MMDSGEVGNLQPADEYYRLAVICASKTYLVCLDGIQQRRRVTTCIC